MICPDCGREIPANSISCQYCGKLFVSQRARVEEAPVHEQVSRLSSQLKDQEQATGQAIGWRRKQRWFFYAAGSLMFIGAVVVIVNIYNSNTKAMADLANVQVRYASKEKQLEDIMKQLDDLNATLNDKDASVTDYKDKLLKSAKSLTEITERNKKLDDDLASAKQLAETSQGQLSAAMAVSNNLLLRLAVNVSEAELLKMPVAVAEAQMIDTDKDGLADELEKVLGTNEVKMDTDDDGFDDKAELENGFNPAGEGKWSNAPAEKYKNTLVLAKKDGLSYIWYVAANGKRYYMGASDNEFKYLLASPYWNTK